MPEETNNQADAAQVNRELKLQARLLERRAAREAARKERERVRAAAVDAEDRPALGPARPAQTRRQARMEQRGIRMARGGDGLERLLDEFSRSGADYLHERTIRVGSRYLVERTTRHGTQYFYEQSPR